MNKRDQKRLQQEAEALASLNAMLKDAEGRVTWLEAFNATHGGCLAQRVTDAKYDRRRIQRRIQQQLRAMGANS